MNWSGWLALLGPTAIMIALVVLGRLSRRLGEATRSQPYYLGFFVAAGLVGVGVALRVADLVLADAAAVRTTLGWVLLYQGMPALGVTLGVILAWRYWSWLLAERS